MLSLAAVGLLTVGLSACGHSDHPSTADNNGVYIQAGPITYQLEISRELNQYATEDAQYLTGLPAGSPRLSRGELWYAVFLWAKNQTKRPQTTAQNFDILDTQGHHYYPVPLNSSLNAYAWMPQQLGPGEIEPGPDTTASFGPTQGRLLLFKLNTSVYDNRPLQLEIRGPARQLWGTISLDL